MPPTRKAFYSFSDYLTGCIPLCFVVTSMASAALAHPGADSLDVPQDLGYAVPQDLSVRLAEEGQAPLHLAALPSAVWDAADNTPMAPHTEAIATEGLSLAQAAPVPVPWDTAQLPTGIPPAGAMPAMPPGMVPGYPIMAPMAGMWMTVWVPYGTPMMMAPTPGMPMPNAPVPQVPGMVPFGMLPQGTVPGTGPGGMPGAAPGGYGAPMVAWPGYPAGVMPGGSYGMVPYGYSYPPAYGYPSAGQPAPGMMIQPYAQVSPPPSPSPLAVPAVPSGSGVLGQSLPLPPTNSGAVTGPVAIVPAPVVPAPIVPTVPSQVPSASPWHSGTTAPTLPLGTGNPTLAPVPAPGVVPAPATPVAIAPTALEAPNQPITEPNLRLQGLYILQGDQSSARARLSGDAFLTPNLAVGGALDLVTGPDLTDSDGVDLTELYLAASVPGVPGLRFRVGQLDLTSYFDRSSFAKDISRDFFNSTFHTNPALIAGANSTSSRPGGLVQWAITDDLNLSAAVFSSASNITDFALDGFAGEVGFRTGDLILRGTFLTGRDTQFQGTGDRLDAYGLNAEWFIPQANLGLFGRYGRLNSSGGFSGDTYSFGINTLDVFMDNDRLGLGYGRNLPNAVTTGSPDVLELFYDFEALPNIRMGFTFQQRNQLRESFAGFRIRSDLNLLPPRSLP